MIPHIRYASEEKKNLTQNDLRNDDSQEHTIERLSDRRKNNIEFYVDNIFDINGCRAKPTSGIDTSFVLLSIPIIHFF